MYLELQFSQAYVRNYFTDISGPVRFYAVNTTLSTFLLFATALIFGVNIMCLDAGSGERGKRIFYVSQVLVFLYLGMDERFGLHEWLGAVMGIRDAMIIFGWGFLEPIPFK